MGTGTFAAAWQKSEVVPLLLEETQRKCLVLFFFGWSFRELRSCSASTVLSLPPFWFQDATKLQTTNVILQIKGAAGAIEKTINCIVQGSLFIIISPHSPISLIVSWRHEPIFALLGNHGNDHFNSTLAVLCITVCRTSHESLIRLGCC